MKSFSSFLVCFMVSFVSYAQEDLLAELEKEENKVVKKEFSQATFKGTRLINTHTIESVGKRAIDFRISHRFGEFNSGFKNFFGLDGGAPMRISAEFSSDGRLTAGLARTFFNESYGKFWEGYLKYRLIRQTVDNKIPISLTVVTAMGITQRREFRPNEFKYFTSRMSYFHQVIIGRKFNKNFSLQAAALLVHRNLVLESVTKNDVWAVSIGGRYKVSGSVALTAEYIARVNNYGPAYTANYNSAGIGVDIETGGHVFQLFIQNSLPISEMQFIPDTRHGWQNGDIRLGFNISRVFGF